jgi:hypothetical protein
MKRLLLATALIEAGAGLALLAWSSGFTRLLLALPLEGAVGTAVARVGGVGLLTLAIAAWFASHDSQSSAARGLVSAMILYNLGAALILSATGLKLHSAGVLLWPVVVLHAGMAIWCAARFLLRPAETETYSS